MRVSAGLGEAWAGRQQSEQCPGVLWKYWSGHGAEGLNPCNTRQKRPKCILPKVRLRSPPAPLLPFAGQAYPAAVAAHGSAPRLAPGQRGGPMGPPGGRQAPLRPPAGGVR